jgi:cytochrome bd ubiquinol oxidase subunit II
VALTLVQGYVLIGSTYLIMKTDGELQTTHYRTAKIAAVTTLIGAVLITIATPVFYESTRARLFDKPLVYVFVAIPLLGVLFVGMLLKSLQNKEERTPFVWTILIFLLSFIGLGLIVFPYIIPTQLTIYQAAASPSALVFMIVFIGFLIPIMIFYNIYNYVVFRGKVAGTYHGE